MDLRAPLASCFLLALLASAPAASAQGLSAQDEANARFQTGLKFYDNHDFESARLAFKQAYAVLQKPGILLNLALSELYSNHALDSIGHFEEVIRDPSTPADKRDKAKKHLEEAMKKTSHLQLRTAPDAQVTLDGRALVPPYTMVHVMPGPHSLEARVGAKTKSANVETKPGDTVDVDLLIESEAPAPPTEPLGTKTSGGDSPTPNPPATVSPPAETPTPSSTRWVVPIALGVGALAGLTVGVVFALENHSSLDDADALRHAGPPNICADRASAQCQSFGSKLDDASTQRTISTIGYVTFVIAGIATVVFWPRGSAKKNTNSTLVLPTLLASPGAAAIGTF